MVVFFVAEEKVILVGYINGGTKDITYRKAKYFEIDNLGVLPKYRQTGVGTKLLETVTSWAKENGYQKIYVSSYIKNQKAVAFYKNKGFQEIDISLEKVI